MASRAIGRRNRAGKTGNGAGNAGQGSRFVVASNTGTGVGCCQCASRWTGETSGAEGARTGQTGVVAGLTGQSNTVVVVESHALASQSAGI